MLHAKSRWACTLVLGQHAELDHYSSSPLKQQSAPIGHFFSIPCQAVFDLILLNGVYLAEEQQI
jgi:hypothetical protein